ncbi:Outer membrane protein OprM precursor [Poriferisphaera corsica]|uniref:Outer membrane protein OprM n=1 Tax=Poriferisphaera corsica TaxID=2528020 RepID=A0A517YY15_9BACT|nr:efflux transporter outer membrane subunit [Poriferisphaera corsica]QDU35097.1 Outer membrane protein OprM precursor [Poriferisphaera corsica]
MQPTKQTTRKRTSSAVRILLCTPLLSLTACNFTPPIDDSPIPLPDTYTQLDPNVNYAEAPTPLPARWWQSFNDPNLSALIEEALTHNFTIKSAWARIDQARAAAAQTGAASYPSVDFTNRNSRTRNEVNSPSNPGMPASTTYSTSLSLGLAASYEVDLWGRIKTQQQAAIAELNATELDLQSAATTLAANIANAWYQLIDQQQQRRILNQQIELNNKHLQVLEARFAVGQAGAPDILQQKQLIESNNASLFQVDSQITVLQNQLAILLGNPPTLENTTFKTPKNLPGLPALPDTGVPANILNNRPDVHAAFIRLQASNYRIATAIADKLPKLSLSLSATTESTNLQDLFDNWLATIAANISAPIFDAGRREAEVDRQKALTDVAYNTYSQTILTALQDIENALAQERNQTKYLASLKTQLDIASNVEEEVRNNYYKGNADFLRVLSAQQSTQTLQRQVSTAHQNLLAFRVALCRALAGNIELEQPQPTQTQTTQTTPADKS